MLLIGLIRVLISIAFISKLKYHTDNNKKRVNIFIIYIMCIVRVCILLVRSIFDCTPTYIHMMSFVLALGTTFVSIQELMKQFGLLHVGAESESNIIEMYLFKLSKK